MKRLAKGKINLTPREKKPKKQEDKYGEVNESKFKYTYDIGQDIIYKGIIEEYHNTLATIMKRTHKNQNTYYTIKFALDDVEKKDINGTIIQSLEEYELSLVKEEERDIQDDELSDVSEIERKILEAGLIPMKNKFSCNNQMMLYHRNCPECCYEPTCIYHKKFQYDKVKFN